MLQLRSLDIIFSSKHAEKEIFSSKHAEKKFG